MCAFPSIRENIAAKRRNKKRENLHGSKQKH